MTTPPPGFEGIQPRRSPLKIALIAVGGILGLCCVFWVAVNAIRPIAPANAPTAATSAPQAVQAIPTKEVAAVAVAATPPAPPSAPTEAPTATVPPTPAPPIDLSGEGQKVTDSLALPSDISRIRFSHNGRKNFVVKAYAPDGAEELLVNTIGSYAGWRSLYAPQGAYFEIQADGAWEMHIEAMGEESGAAALTGTGDYASGVFTPARIGPVPYAFTHNGKKNFIVRIFCAGGDDFAQNEIGAVAGEAVVRIEEGPCFWEVRADGDWSIQPK